MAHTPEPPRPELAELQARKKKLLDDARPHAVAKRRKTGQRTARENVADLVDAGSFQEYGGLTVAAQRLRHSDEELQQLSPADGLVAGTATVNAAAHGAEAARCVVLAYDYTVFAGTQGTMNHKKLDRMLEVAAQGRLPVVLYAEGGGGRPSDVDVNMIAGLDLTTFARLAGLSGLVPKIGVVAGRCFAGNAALLGCCDVVIATENSNLGMGGPAMIEGGGLGRFAPEDIGPVGVQAANGVVDIRVADEAAATAAARQYLSYFQGPVADFAAPDQAPLDHVIPANRRRAFQVRKVIETVADAGSVLELRSAFGRSLVTALARVAGRPVGVLANDCRHGGGAIDADASDKAARFLQLCDAFGLPVVSFCDTPGFMVGPDAEKQALVRHAARFFIAAATLAVPLFTVVLRRGYGLGAMAMAGGHTHASFFTVAWPTGDFGAMGVEGAVKLGFKKQLEAVADPREREDMFQQLVALAYERGKALNMATHLEIDDVIDPAETRARIIAGLQAAQVPARSGRRRVVDAW
jgi:acetyl-CoA carboxylase carboxyltransferase component